MIFLLFNVTLSLDMPFCKPLCLHHGSTRACLCTPFLFPLPCRWEIAVHALWHQCETWANSMLAEVLLMFSLAWNVTQCVRSIVCTHWTGYSKTFNSTWNLAHTYGTFFWPAKSNFIWMCCSLVIITERFALTFPMGNRKSTIAVTTLS